jgi:hypothetical protein
MRCWSERRASRRKAGGRTAGELAKLDLRLNEAKSRVVDLTKGEAFGFLGFTIRRLRSKRGKWWSRLTPAVKQRTALLRKLKEKFRRWDSQPVGEVIAVINPILRGWVNYFRVAEQGHARAQFNLGTTVWPPRSCGTSQRSRREGLGDVNTRVSGGDLEPETSGCGPSRPWNRRAASIPSDRAASDLRPPSEFRVLARAKSGRNPLGPPNWFC